MDLEYLSEETVLTYVVCITCSLSIIGSLLIILTYVFFRELRTKVRLILLHLSFMDLGIALSNLVGTAIKFDKYYYRKEGAMIEWMHPSSKINALCKTQAFFAIYSTYGSVFWTNCLALYLYFAVIHHSTAKANRILWFSYIFCYLMPLGMSLWQLLTGRLGVTPYGSGGWCTIIDIDPISKKKDYLSVSLGYDMWIYLTFILVPVLFVGIRSHISLQFEKSKEFVTHKTFWTAIHAIDYKFLLIPLTFILLRIWTCIVTITTVYSDGLSTMNETTHLRYLFRALVYLSAIGDSGQGAANAIIFVFFTKRVRKHLNPFKRRGEDLTERDPLNAKKIPKRNSYYSSNITPPPSPSPSPRGSQTNPQI